MQWHAKPLLNRQSHLPAMSSYDDKWDGWMSVVHYQTIHWNTPKPERESLSECVCSLIWVGLWKKREKVLDFQMTWNYILVTYSCKERVHPPVVAKNTRVAKNGNGEKRFSANQYLAVGKITSFLKTFCIEKNNILHIHQWWRFRCSSFE